MYFRDSNGVEIAGIYTDTNGNEYGQNWLKGATDTQLAGLGVTKHERVMPAYDEAAQKLVKQPSGEYLVVALSNEEIRRKAKASLNDKLNTMSYTYADGRVIQTRPQDLTNFQLVIAKGQDEEWVMADNTLSVMTVAELNEALNWAINQAGLYWDEYKDVIRSLP